MIGSTFLLLEKDPNRLAKAIKLVLDGLEVYLEKAFSKDGSSSEGIGYWHYGMMWFTVFSEMLRESTSKQIDLLNLERVKTIASYPAKIQLSSNLFASFSDMNEQHVGFSPGFIQRLAERTGEKSLLGLISEPIEPDYLETTCIFRFILWWDGNTHTIKSLKDSVLPDAGIARFVSLLTDETQITLAIKAGHNAENHNHNDIGSFVLNINGENILTDPGAGLYDFDYFSAKRYENIFTNSFGHSVPRINGKLQSSGKEFFGTLNNVISNIQEKKAEISFTKAYNVSDLKNATRILSILREDDKETYLKLEDVFEATNELEIEEAFITWLEVDVKENKAIIHGKNHKLVLLIEEPNNIQFSLNKLEKESKINNKIGILKRLCFTVSGSTLVQIRVKMTIVPSN